jgi:NAD+ synthase (glutamine-hydrolysing)
LVLIQPAFESFLTMLNPAFAGLPPDVTEENLQARIRGNILMAFSNKSGALLLNTGNKSELAVGCCTMYGDMAGGLAVIADVPKNLVYELARHVNRAHSPTLPRKATFRGAAPPSERPGYPSALRDSRCHPEGLR